MSWPHIQINVNIRRHTTLTDLRYYTEFNRKPEERSANMRNRQPRYILAALLQWNVELHRWGGGRHWRCVEHDRIERRFVRVLSIGGDGGDYARGISDSTILEIDCDGLSRKQAPRECDEALREHIGSVSTREGGKR